MNDFTNGQNLARKKFLLGGYNSYHVKYSLNLMFRTFSVVKFFSLAVRIKQLKVVTFFLLKF